MRIRSSSSAFLLATLAISSSSSCIAAPTGDKGEGMSSSPSTRNLASTHARRASVSARMDEGYTRRDIAPPPLIPKPTEADVLRAMLVGLSDEERAKIRAAMNGDTSLFDSVVATLPPAPSVSAPAPPLPPVADSTLHRLMEVMGIDDSNDSSPTGPVASSSVASSSASTSSASDLPMSSDAPPVSSTSTAISSTPTDLQRRQLDGLIGTLFGLPLVGGILQGLLASLGLEQQSVSPAALAMLSALSTDHLHAIHSAAVSNAKGVAEMPDFASSSTDPAATRRRAHAQRDVLGLANLLSGLPAVGGLLETILASIGIKKDETSSAAMAMLSALSADDLNALHDSARASMASAMDADNQFAAAAVDSEPSSTISNSYAGTTQSAASTSAPTASTVPVRRRSENPRNYQIRYQQPRALSHRRQNSTGLFRNLARRDQLARLDRRDIAGLANFLSGFYELRPMLANVLATLGMSQDEAKTAAALSALTPGQLDTIHDALQSDLSGNTASASPTSETATMAPSAAGLAVESSSSTSTYAEASPTPTDGATAPPNTPQLPNEPVVPIGNVVPVGDLEPSLHPST